MGRGQRRRRGAAGQRLRHFHNCRPLHSARPHIGAEMKKFSLPRIAFVAFCALVLLYLMLPVLIIVPMSFSSTRFLTFPPPALSLRWYQEYIGNAAWMQATRVTFAVA